MKSGRAFYECRLVPVSGFTVCVFQQPPGEGSRFQNRIIAGRKLPHGGPDAVEVFLQRRPVIGPKLQYGDAPPGKVLLVAEILVRDDEGLEPRRFGGIEQPAIAETAQPSLGALLTSWPESAWRTWTGTHSSRSTFTRPVPVRCVPCRSGGRQWPAHARWKESFRGSNPV